MCRKDMTRIVAVYPIDDKGQSPFKRTDNAIIVALVERTLAAVHVVLPKTHSLLVLAVGLSMLEMKGNPKWRVWLDQVAAEISRRFTRITRIRTSMMDGLICIPDDSSSGFFYPCYPRKSGLNLSPLVK